MMPAQPSPYSEPNGPPPWWERASGRARVYVASALPNLSAAVMLARQLRAVGVEVVSSWHAETYSTVEVEARLPLDRRARLAEKCFSEIDRADVFVWLHGFSSGRVGAAVEYGYALKGGKIIYLVSIDGEVAPSVFGALGPEITATALLRRLGGA